MKDKRKLKKVLFASVLAANLCVPMTAYARERYIDYTIQDLGTNVIQPRFQYTNSVSIEFDFTGRKAFGCVMVEGKNTATKITGTYRLTFSGKVYSGTKSENVSGYLDAVCE